MDKPLPRNRYPAYPMRPKHLLPACALLASTAVAQVFIGDVATIAVPPPGYDTVVGLTLSIPSGQGAASFSFESIDSGGLSTRIGAINIAEYYSLFLVADGVVFDAAYVSSHTAITDNSGSLPSYTLPYSDGQSVLFAYWDDRSAFGGAGAWGAPDSTDLYGWMRVDFSLGTDPDTLDPVVRWTIADSATARGGILVGTYTQVPEPASVAFLAGLAGLGFHVARRRRSR